MIKTTVTLAAVLLVFSSLLASQPAKSLDLVAPTAVSDKSASAWSILENRILSTKSKNINIYWAGTGGFVTLGDAFISTMMTAQKQGKRINFKITNDAVSMHANIVCYGDSVTWINKKAILFYHAPKRPTLLGFGEYEYSPKGSWGYEKVKSYLNACRFKKFLTTNNIKDIMIKHKAVVVDKNNNKIVVKDHYKP